MRTKFLYAALALASAAAVGFSSDKAPVPAQRAPGDNRPDFAGHGREAAERALRDYYGVTAKARITSEFENNGIRVFNATVERDGAIAEATLTAAGDYISMGVPEPLAALTPGAQETAQLFKSPAVSITREDIHAYYVTVKGPGNRPFTFEFDAAGRVRDIKTADEIRADAVLQRVGGPEARKMTDITMKRFSNVQVENVEIASHNPGYFMVPFHNKDGHGWAIISEANDVAEWRYPEPLAVLPEPVRRAIDHELRGDRIINIEQGAAKTYRIAQNVGGEELVMLVNSAGGVDWISSRELHRPTLREFHPGPGR